LFKFGKIRKKQSREESRVERRKEKDKNGNALHRFSTPRSREGENWRKETENSESVKTVSIN